MKGASAVPLIGRASVASDRSIIPPGTTLLAEVRSSTITVSLTVSRAAPDGGVGRRWRD
ncbi:hypothetical protein ACNKHQ_16210 [Shigella flexneri]